MSGVRKRTKGAPAGSSESELRNKKDKIRNKSNESSSLLSLCFKIFFCILVLLGLVALFGYYNAPFTALSIPDYAKEVKLEGEFAVNKKIAKGTKTFGLFGPESIEEDEKGNLYTGLGDGRIVRIAPSSDGVIGMGRVHTLVDSEQLSKTIKSSGVTVGRPLGLRLLRDTLYVADAFLGIYFIDLKSNRVTSLVAPDALTPKFGFFNDLSFSKDETFIYFTDVTSKYSLATLMLHMLEGLCDGRVLQYNTKTKEIRTVMSDLCFPNGIQLSMDNKLLFVSETFRYRVRIIDMTNWKTKQFVDLPISPDNIRPTGKGTFWVAGPIPWTRMFEITQKHAVLRQIIAGLFSINTVFKSLPFKPCMAVEISEEGEILQTLHDPDVELTTGLSQVTPLKDGRLALGSIVANWMSVSENKIDAVGKA